MDAPHLTPSPSGVLAWARERRTALRALFVLAPAIFGAIRALYVLLARSTYPYHLDGLESDLFSQAVALERTGRLYDDPATGFLWHFYGPVHTVVLAALFSIVGPSLPAARAVSSLATLGTTLVLGHWVRRSSGSGAAGLFAGALYLALFAASGCWYDVARVDSLGVFLAVAGAACLHLPGTVGWKRRGAACALLLAAVLTKQNLLLISLGALALAPLALRGRRLMLGGFLLGLLAAGGALALATENRFLGYAVVLPTAYPFRWKAWRLFLDLITDPPFLAVPLLFVPMVLALVSARATREGARGRAWGLFAAAFAASTVSMFKTGGLLNNLMPAAAFGALALGLSVAAARGPACPVAARLGTIAAAVALPLVSSLSFSAAEQIPSPRDRRLGDAIVEYLKGFPGRYWALDFNYLHVLAGGDPPPTAIAMTTMGEPMGIEREEKRALLRGEFELVLTDEQGAYIHQTALLSAYERSREMRSLPGNLRARVGPPTGISAVWVPRARRVVLPPFPDPDRPR